MTVLLFVVAIVLFIGLIIVHEYGHFIAARRNGVEVEEFGIFFPPRLYKKRMKGGWNFTINAVPLGGFVRLKGEHDSDMERGSFGAATLWVKSKIMAAGVFMNLITALALFTIVALIGMPQLVDNQFTVKSDTHLVSSKTLIGYVDQGSPAAKAGLQPRDTITGLAKPGYSPVSVDRSERLPDITRSFAGQTVNLSYIRNGEHRTAQVTLLDRATVEASRNTDDPKGYLGIVPTDYTILRSTWSAPVVAVGFTAQVTALTFQGLGNALAGLGSTIAGLVTGNQEARQEGQTRATEQVAGPVGIFVILRDGSLLGIEFILMVISIISLTLAIMNFLPIPALDGGRLWMTLIARAFKRPLTPKMEEAVTAAGFVLVVGLIILITIVDINRFF